MFIVPLEFDSCGEKLLKCFRFVSSLLRDGGDQSTILKKLLSCLLVAGFLNALILLAILVIVLFLKH